MYPNFKANTSINKSVSSGLNETQLETLQREVDNYTRKLEQEKRKYFSIQDTFKSISQQYERQKNKLNQLKKENSKAQNVMLQAKIKNLQANLDKAISTYDDTVAYNNKLKLDIDMLRRQKKNFLEMHKSLEEQIIKLENQSVEKVQLIQKKKRKAQELKNQIMQIKIKNQEERQTYMKQFDSLEKQYMKEKKQRQQSKMFDKNEKPQPIDTQPLLKHRLKKIVIANKQKMKMIQQYKKHMKMIEQAFNDIKSKSGIQDLNEITNTFIKSEEQNYSLYNYMDVLSQNIDNLQQANAELQERIAKQHQQNESRKKILSGTPEEQKRRKQLQLYTQQKQQTSKQLNQLIDNIKPILENALLELAKSSFNDDPKKLQDYQLGFNICDRTIQEYLSDLQKYINTLLIVKQQAKTKIVNNLKDNVTNYTKVAPIIGNQQLKQKLIDYRDQNKFMEENKFRQYANEYLEKKKLKNKQ